MENNCENDINDYFDIITQHFNKSFFDVYEKIFAAENILINQELSHKYHVFVLQHMPMLFNKWMLSALIEETLLSPSNMLSAQMEYIGEKGTVSAQVYLKSKPDSVELLEYKLIPYSIDAHPIIDDLKLFLKYCAEGYDLNLNKNFYDYSFLKNFSVPTRQYIDYLTNISLKFKLIKKLPSINSTVVQVLDENNVFFKKSNKDILMAIVKFTIDECVTFISQILPLPTYFKQSLYEMLVNPVPIEDIFKILLEDIHLDFEQFIELTNNKNEFSDIFSGMMDLTAATFGLGIVIDKHFLTPFGAYLKLIHPIYLLPYNFTDDIRILFSCIDGEINEDTAIYSPCSGYFLTHLGRELFKQDKIDDEFNLPGGISLEPIFSSIRLDGKISAKILTDMNKSLGKRIIRFYVKSSRLMVPPVVIEIDETESMEALHECICISFDADSFCEYAFFLGNDNSPFSVYSSNGSQVKGRKAQDSLMKSLQLTPKTKFKLLIYDTITSFSLYEMPKSEDVEFEIEVVRLSPGKYGYLYPRET